MVQHNNKGLTDNQVFSRLGLDPKQLLHANAVFLDLGCGRREDIAKGVEFHGASYVGIDVGPDAPIRCDSHALCLKSESVDVVFSAATMEHFRNPWKVVEEVVRVLKPGGVFLGLVAFIQPEHGYPGSYFHMSAKGTRVLLEDNGFVKTRTLGGGGPYCLEYLVKAILSPLPVVNWMAGKFARYLEMVRFVGEWLNLEAKVLRGELKRECKSHDLQARLERWDAAIVFYGEKPKIDGV